MFFQKNINKILEEANAFVMSLNVDGEYAYKFSQSCQKDTLYASVYACMVRAWLNNITEKEKQEWGEYFNSFQNSEGFYIDNNCFNEKYMNGDGWGARHLIPHILIALKRTDSQPKYEFSFLNKMKNPDNIVKLLESLDFKNIWGSSNTIMNYGVSMQYARDYMNLPFHDSILALEEWLIKRIRSDCGMWQMDKNIENHVLYETIRGAYHIYPLFIYDNIKIPYFEKAMPYLLRAQNSQGGFDVNKNSSACDDIDAIDPLLRIAAQFDMRNNLTIRKTIWLAKRNILNNRNGDGGFVFDRRSEFAYGGAQQLSSKLNESNLFGTWFRLLSLLLIENYYGNKDINLLDFPGYELKI